MPGGEMEAGTEAGLERTLRDRLEAVERADGDWRAGQAEDRRRIALDAVPLVLLGAGSILAQPLVRHAVEHWTVAGLVDNARAGTVRDGQAILDDAGLLELLRREPAAVGVMCCNSDDAVGHFQDLWRPFGRPLLSLFEAMRWAGLQAPDMMGAAGSIGGLLEEGGWRKLADPGSRRSFLSVLLYRLTWDSRWLDPVRLPYRDMYFFTDALLLGEGEVLVDGGAFDGDTAAAFLARTAGTHRHIHAFEADPVNLAPLRRRLAGMPRTTIHPVGLWSRSDTLRFSSGQGPGGRLGEGGDVAVPVRALDDLDLGPVTLIKLDIEGAEVPALEGAAETIRRHRPKLAVAVYHALEDFGMIPALIERLRPGSRYRLRHHSPLHHDTVLYVD
jgi:FkbM family methyltransferase